MNEIKLKLCPFCGGKAMIHNRVNKVGRTVYVAECKKCLSKSNWYDDPEKAAMLWNGRFVGFADKKTRP